MGCDCYLKVLDCLDRLSSSLLSAMSQFVLGQGSPKPGLQSPHAAAAKKEAEEVQYTSNKCPECQAQFGSKEEVFDHFQEIKAAHSTVSHICV